MTATQADHSLEILVVASDHRRTSTLRQLTNLVLPRASVASIDSEAVAECTIPAADVALVDSGETARGTVDTLRFLRGRGFAGPIVVLAPGTPDPSLHATALSLGATCITRSVAEERPAELGAALTAALGDSMAVVAEVTQARRIFAAGQAAFSLQHSINNPLAALLAEAQLLQLEELTREQREAVDRMIELSRRIVALVRKLDALASS